MFEIHAVIGTFLLSFGAATGVYLIYKLYETQKIQRANCGSIAILISETIIATLIGILHIYCYTCCVCSEELQTEIKEIFSQLQRQENSTVEECEVAFECVNKKILVEQLVLTISALHSFLSLITSSSLCKIKNCSTDESSTNLEKSRPSIQTTLISIIAQWLIPILSACCLCYTLKVPNDVNICEAVIETKVPETFHTLVSELLDKPLNVTETSMYATEIDNIIGKVYSIVESATQPNNIQVNDLDEGFQILNIIEKLNKQNHRTPKQMKYDFPLNMSFKIYTMILLLFGFILPFIYANISHMKLKIVHDVTVRLGGTNNLQDKMKYLKVSMISAATLWSPSFIEMFSRTYITQNHPNIVMHILMIIGSSYMLIRYGINLKLAKSFVGLQNSIIPKV